MTAIPSVMWDVPTYEYEESEFDPDAWLDDLVQDEDGLPGTGPKGQWTSIF